MRNVLLALGLCSLTACGGSSSSDFALPEVEEASAGSEVEANVGPAGGTLATSEATLEVPAGAVSENTTFRVARRDGATLAFGTTLSAGPTFALEPSGATFDTPVLVTIPYDPAAITAPDTPNDLIALLQDTRTGRVEQLTPTRVDTTAQTATYEVPHFSNLQNALLARVLPQFTTLSADPAVGLAPGQTTTLTISVRNQVGQEFGGLAFALTASGGGNTFGATTVTTGLDGLAQTTFTTSEGGTKTITASFSGTTIQTLDLLFGLPPTANPDTGSTDEDTVLMGASLLANDSDPDMDPLSAVAESVTSTLGASVVIAADGTYTYDPSAAPTLQAIPAMDSAMDTFTYTVSDGVQSASGTATITVAGLNDAPATTADTGAADADATLNGSSVLANDQDVDTGDTLSAVAESVTSPAGANVSIASDGTYAYDPSGVMAFIALPQGGTAVDAFDYQATDGAAVVTGTVTVTVTGVNDTPAAVDSSAQGVEGSPLTLTLTGSDPDGEALTFAIATGPSNGSLGAISQLTPTSASVTYTPNMGFSGSDAFTFTANDGNATSPAATFSLTLDPLVRLSGLARFEDVNQNKVPDAGDTLIVPFDANVSGRALSDVVLEVAGDTFGAGATIADGPEMNEQTITLGASATLKVRQDFDAMDADAGSPSGLDLSSMVPGFVDGSPVDLVPGFETSVLTVAPSGFPVPAVAADMNGDGLLDLVATGRVFLNDGASPPGFTSNVSYDSTVDTQDLAVADLDHDGDLDIVIANGGGSMVDEQNVVYLNDGSDPPAFTTVNVGPSTGNSIAAEVGDLNGDGHLDLYFADVDFMGMGARNVLYLNDGNVPPAFTTSVNVGGLTLSSDAALADFDGDGDLDILDASLSLSRTALFLNDGNDPPAFTLQDFSTRNDQTLDVAIGDMNGDGHVDVLTHNTQAQGDRIHLNNGSNPPGFNTVVDFGSSVDDAGDLVVADLDLDGDLDVVRVVDLAPNEIYFNDGALQLVGPFDFGTNRNFKTDVTVADFDGDGDLDLYENAQSRDTLFLNSLLRDAPVLGAPAAFDLATGETFVALPADVDGDGDLDLVVGNDQQQNTVHLNDGSGAYTATVDFGTGTDRTNSVLAVDVDGDGDLDLVVGNGFSEPNAIYLNDGDFSDGNYAVAVNFGTGTDSTTALAAADLDRDGDLDLALGNFNEQNVVLFNDGSGAFGSPLDFGTGMERTWQITASDIDADGDLDLVCATNFDQQNVIYLNDGDFSDGNYAVGISFGTGADSTTAAIPVDVDRDGDLDLVCSNFAQQNVIYRNDGMGGFGTSVTFGPVDDRTRGLAVVDVDLDGDLDLLVGNLGEQDVLYLNDGALGFATTVDVGGSSDATFFVTTADVDRDGDPDPVIGYEGAVNAVFERD